MKRDEYVTTPAVIRSGKMSPPMKLDGCLSIYLFLASPEPAWKPQVPVF